MQYRQDLFIITHYHKRKRFPSYTRCSENHNNTCTENRKIRGLKFDTLYWRHLVAQRKISTWVYNYMSSPIKSPQNIFENCTVQQTFGAHKRWPYRALLALPLQFDSFIVAPCNTVAKYFYTGAHLQYMWYKAVVKVFFHLAFKWSKWCAQTLHPFSQILTIFYGTYRSVTWRKFPNLFPTVEKAFLPQENAVNHI